MSNDSIRPELQELRKREAYLWDENRKEAIDKLHKRGQLSARESLGLLCDEGSFNEYGALTVSGRRTVIPDEYKLLEISPADGVILGTANINSDLFGKETTRCAVMSYDQSVMAGTQGIFGHIKTDRVLELAYKEKLPFVVFAGGGGGRPGDADVFYHTSAGLNIATWENLGRLSGRVPFVSIVSRYCFAGNAAFAGCADVIIMTKNSSLGMGGPAMIEGGGMGIVAAQDVGPTEQQFKNGVADIVVEDDREAVEVAKKYLSYFQGPLDTWEAHDQTLLRNALPESVRRSYKVGKIIELICDKDSVMELRKDYAINMVTCLARIEGRPVGIIANNTGYQAGAVDAPAADKMARFMQLCNAHRIPLISLIDCPGFMVGVDAEKEALVRHACRLYVVGSHVVVPKFSIFLRACYGLGGIAMGFGHFKANVFAASWPTGRFGAMGDEGAIYLGSKKELDAAQAEGPEKFKETFDRLLAELREQSSAFKAGATMEADAVIDPAVTREWIANGLRSTPIPPKTYSDETFIDSW